MWETCFPRFHVSTSEREGESLPPFLRYMTEKFKNCVETAEIMINYAETIIDLATELQYLLVEQEAVKEDKESNSFEEVPELRTRGCGKERTQTFEGEMGASVDVQKLYIPVYRLSQKNVCPDESVENKKAQ